MENTASFNLNYYVRVKLTDKGYQRLAYLFNGLLLENPQAVKSLGGMRTAEHYKEQADANGYTKFQGWEFMKKFGGDDVIGMGFTQLFDINILIEQKDLHSLITSTE